ncbi:MAG: hypothetical protein ACYCO9_15730 [Streptosporangiaceae bacterium]
MSAMKKKLSAMPTSDMQDRARKLAAQASRLAEQAGPATKKAATAAQQGAQNVRVRAGTARQGANQVADWARPQVIRTRSWMAARAASGSHSVQETVAPKVSSMLATAARKLEPPRPKARRWPRKFLRITLLTAAAAAVTGIMLRNRPRYLAHAVPPQPPTAGGDQAAPGASATQADGAMTEKEYNGMSRTKH